MYYSLDILALVFSSLATPQKCHRARIPNTMKVCAVSLANDPMTVEITGVNGHFSSLASLSIIAWFVYAGIVG